MSAQVLIVDADTSAAQVTAAVVQRILPAATITCETTPERAWQAAQRQTPDALIVDPSPHRRAGVLLIELCRETAPAVKIVVLASAPTPSLRARTTELGVDAYLEKPVASAVLVSQLRAVLESVRSAEPALGRPAPQP